MIRSITGLRAWFVFRFKSSLYSTTIMYVLFYQDEKKYFQLELVNRETNFNKVFNAVPNVGLINPLVKVTSDFPSF